MRVGNPPLFQGDERKRHVRLDGRARFVVRGDNGALRGNGRNVAASRAQDQLWIFHSMDAARSTTRTTAGR